ncbi:right-handed parallel beta-helix repeat-containing protein [Streptomyces sp. MB09-01]|uniref:right-handed parallel beta-helix repeat-containing protein n=1 Tax=Streptomyces sp. MB09-01 TaxID=3028666 RepID=UPI0029B6DA2B|nr:right-handed parallel beta-helix repeat-containing protein [Streptomyces sp. MB09-01]MDX3536330.1 right-handed parallel beta-helix repeat-containing protein [Streptomyces sp. MB09-01]
MGAIACLAGCDVLKPYTPPRPPAKGPLTFYVSPEGDDERDGLSEATAWRTLARADQVPFRPGDRLRLKGGERFTGGLTIGTGDAGSVPKPVVIDSYGTGRATIAARGTAGIAVYNTAGVEIRNLVLVGDAKAQRSADGISFFNDLGGGRPLNHVRISGVDVSRFQHGIRVGTGPRSTGFRDIQISDSAVHHNQDAGLVTYGPRFTAKKPGYAHEQLVITRVRAYSNPGDPTADDRNTGSGIVLGSVRNATVQQSVSYDNGAKSSALAQEGPEGIWTYDSTRVIIQNNRAYRNRTGSRVDGGGFGLDNNVSSSVLQYNLSYGNDGAGFLVYSGEPSNAHRDNVVRFNYSWDDARKLPWYGGIVAYGNLMRNLEIYHNTVILRSSGIDRPPALRLRNGMSGVGIRNNIFVTNGAPVVDSDTNYTQALLRLQGNDYFSTGDWKLQWGKVRYSDLQAWRQRAGQERMGTEPTGSTADPCLEGTAAPVTDLAGATKLVSTCADQLEGAVKLRSLGVDPGLVDYFGARLSTAPSAGAAQLGEED